MNRFWISWVQGALVLTLFTGSLTAQEPSQQPQLPAESTDIAAPAVQPEVVPEKNQELQAREHEVADLRNKLSEAGQDRESLQTQLRDLRQRLAQARQQSESLGNQLEALRQEGYGILPSNFSAAELKWLTDTTAVVEATLNRGGIVMAKLYSLAGGGRSPQLQSQVSDYQSTHRFRFPDLSPTGDYEVELVVLNLANKETNVRANATTHPSDLRFRMHSTPSAPTVTATTAIAADHVDVTLTASEDVHLRVVCMKHLPDRATPVEAGVEGGDLLQDEYGPPRGGVRLTKGEARRLTFKTDPATEYSIQWTGYAAATGREVPKPLSDFQKFATLALPIPLDFRGGFGFILTPTKVELRWQATRKPTAARVEMKINEIEYRVVNALEQSIAEDAITVSLGASALAQVEQQADQDKQKSLQLRAVMEDENQNKITADFEIAVRLDPQEEGLSPQQKAGVTKVLEVATQGKGKIDWREIAKTGVPLILSFL